VIEYTGPVGPERYNILVNDTVGWGVSEYVAISVPLFWAFVNREVALVQSMIGSESLGA